MRKSANKYRKNYFGKSIFKTISNKTNAFRRYAKSMSNRWTEKPIGNGKLFFVKYSSTLLSALFSGIFK